MGILVQETAAASDKQGKPTKFERRKEEILRAAGALVNRHGLRDTTLALVASEIGLNLKSLRYYFEKREDLVAAAFLRSIRIHRELVEQALAIDDFAARIRHVISAYFALLARVRRGEEPQFVYFNDIRGLTEPHIDEVGAAYVDMFRLARRLFHTDALALAPEEEGACAHMLLSQLYWSVMWTTTHAPEDLPRAAARFSDILLHGIAAKPVDVAGDYSVVATPFSPSDQLSQQSFLQAATHLINDYGYRGASVDRISATLNVTKGAFYHYNDTRDELVIACFERSFDIIRQAQNDAMAKDGDGLSHVMEAAAALVARQMLPEGSLLRTAALTALGMDHRMEMNRRLSMSTWRFADMLNDGLIDGSVRIADMRIAAEAVTAMINSAQELQRWVPKSDVRNAPNLYVRPLLNGFLRIGHKSG